MSSDRLGSSTHHSRPGRPPLTTDPTIIGVAEIPPRRDVGAATALDLVARVARDALLDAALLPADIDGLLRELRRTYRRAGEDKLGYLGARSVQ